MNCVSILLQNSTSLTNNKRRNKRLVSQNIELGRVLLLHTGDLPLK